MISERQKSICVPPSPILRQNETLIQGFKTSPFSIAPILTSKLSQSATIPRMRPKIDTQAIETSKDNAMFQSILCEIYKKPDVCDKAVQYVAEAPDGEGKALSALESALTIRSLQQQIQELKQQERKSKAHGIALRGIGLSPRDNEVDRLKRMLHEKDIVITRLEHEVATASATAAIQKQREDTMRRLDLLTKKERDRTMKERESTQKLKSQLRQLTLATEEQAANVHEREMRVEEEEERQRRRRKVVVGSRSQPLLHRELDVMQGSRKGQRSSSGVRGIIGREEGDKYHSVSHNPGGSSETEDEEQFFDDALLEISRRNEELIHHVSTLQTQLTRHQQQAKDKERILNVQIKDLQDFNKQLKKKVRELQTQSRSYMIEAKQLQAEKEGVREQLDVVREKMINSGMVDDQNDVASSSGVCGTSGIIAKVPGHIVGPSEAIDDPRMPRGADSAGIASLRATWMKRLVEINQLISGLKEIDSYIKKQQSAGQLIQGGQYNRSRTHTPRPFSRSTHTPRPPSAYSRPQSRTHTPRPFSRGMHGSRNNPFPPSGSQSTQAALSAAASAAGMSSIGGEGKRRAPPIAPAKISSDLLRSIFGVVSDEGLRMMDSVIRDSKRLHSIPPEDISLPKAPVADIRHQDHSEFRSASRSMLRKEDLRGITVSPTPGLFTMGHHQPGNNVLSHDYDDRSGFI
ncbi:hypothetical protein ADUPG1_008565 [Aduncisulcus paluster]|uniref:Uncharacterized protein n=1 Tax=Aduncisulcus paluster TaxID=2918883 RepID=A0ABQ5KVB7_9EUKA|nr:hypothetical protein ADUPG1_008565 [Aduncisulcus paluster]